MNSRFYLDVFPSIKNVFAGRAPRELIRKAANLWQREGAEGLRRALGDILNAGISYREWILQHDSLSSEDRILISEHIAQLDYKPLISVLIPVYNTPEKWLVQAIDTVRNQLYPHWELCIADDASTLPHVRKILEEAETKDSRIKVVFRNCNGHISEATNSALEIASGDFVALLDHDDELAAHALYHVAVALNSKPQLDLIYSDEDKIDDKGRRFGHYFKPDWNPDLFLAQNLISHLGVYRTQIARDIGGFRKGFEGSQDWDFALRFVEHINSENILHLPYVLYHWRTIPGSTAISVDEKDYAKDAAKRALLEFWRTRNMAPQVEHLASGHFRTKFSLPHQTPLVSIVLVSTRHRVQELLSRVSDIWSCTEYSNVELLVIDTEGRHTLGSQIDLSNEGRQLRILPYQGSSNLPSIYNWAIAQAVGSVICLLDAGVQPLARDWLKEMVTHALREGTGAVGGITYWPDNTICDAGYIWTEEGEVKPLYCGYPKGVAGYVNRARLVQNLSIVSTACLVVRKSICLKVEGLNPNYSLNQSFADFCLRVEELGYRNVWTPHAEFQLESVQKRDLQKGLHKRNTFSVSNKVIDEAAGSHDPAWNPNLVLNGRYTQLAAPPKVPKPWLS